MEEHVVLVDDSNKVLGTAPKATIHTDQTPLHRGFSVFVFDATGNILLQQRNLTKVTWPGIWSNTCCGHPALDESGEAAVRRRLKDELGLSEVTLYELLPDYRYRCEKHGIVENELCPVFVGFTTQQPTINPEEAENTRWLPWREFVRDVTAHPDQYSPWCVEETQLLDKSKSFHLLFTRHIRHNQQL
jgi:isopentenyl-diphosphate delta-isomerase